MGDSTKKEVKMVPLIEAKWHYFLNENGEANWRCTNCKKVREQYPHDEYFCCRCGASMTFES